MSRFISILAVFVVAFFPIVVFAHGGGSHLMGTVESLDAQHVVVKTKEGKTTSILLNTETKYRKDKTAAKGADLQVGDRVVVHASGKGDKMMATEIRFASPSKGKGQGEVHHHPTAP